MNKKAVVGLFPFADDTIKAIEELKEAGFKEIDCFSPVPCEEIEEALHEEEKISFGPKTLFNKIFTKREFQVARFTALGAIGTILVVILFAIITFLLYPIQTGGMPIIVIPPVGLSAAIMGALGAVIMSALGFIYLAKLPALRWDVYDAQASKDRFCLIFKDKDEQRLAEAKEIMARCGCEKVAEKEEI